MDVLTRMETFVRVVESGSLSAASRRMRMSLAAVSRQLAQLESELGATLIVRTTRRSAITESGRAFYERSVRILGEVEDARASVRSDREPAGLLVVSAPVSLALARIAPALPALLDAHPRLRVDLRLEDRVVDLLAEGVDVAIRAGVSAPDSASLVAHPLATFRRVLVASPRYLAKHGRPREPLALARHRALVHLPAFARPGAWTLRRGEESVSVRVDGPLRTNALLVLRDAALEGRGIALMTDFMVDDALADGRLERVLPEWEGPSADVQALHHVELRRSASVRALAVHLRATWARAPRPLRRKRRAR
jgi:DNA-binding transcriptional LysR family regulator